MSAFPRTPGQTCSLGAQLAVFTHGGTAAQLFQPPGTVSQDTALKALKRHAKQFRTSRKITIHPPKKLRASAEFARMAPSMKINRLASGRVMPRAVSRYVADSTQANLLKQVRGSLPGMASDFRRYLSFCELDNAAPLPPMEETVLRWSSVFNDTATYGNYVGQLQKVCFFLRQSTVWLTPAVRHVAKGLKKSQDRSFRFSNFIRSQLMVKLIEFDTPSREFPQAAFLSFLFAFRVPSETLQLRRAYSADELLVFAPQQDPALIGSQVVDGGPFLVAKLSYRKNITGGCIMRRPCFFGLASRKARQLCPIHLFWAIIRCLVDCGALLFQSVNRRNFNRIMKTVSPA